MRTGLYGFSPALIYTAHRSVRSDRLADADVAYGGRFIAPLKILALSSIIKIRICRTTDL